MLLQVKKFSEKLLLPLAKKIKKFPANYLTILSLLCAVMVFLGFLLNWILLFLIFLFFTELFDQLDGIVARLQGPTRLGAFLDSTLDRLGDFFICIGIILGGYTDVYIGLIVLIGSFMTSYTRAKIEALGINEMYGIGLLERTDRIPILFIGSIFQLLFPKAIFWTMIFLAFGTVITSLQRIIYAYNKLSKRHE